MHSINYLVTNAQFLAILFHSIYVNFVLNAQIWKLFFIKNNNLKFIQCRQFLLTSCFVNYVKQLFSGTLK